MRGSTRRKLLWTVTTLYWIVIFVSTHIPVERLPKLPLSDKTEHVVMMGVLASLLMIVVPLSKPRWNAPVAVLTICMIYGAIDEWLQIPVNRSCDLFDWYADTTGAAIGVVVVSAVRRVVR